jgi:hypothetical protein
VSSVAGVQLAHAQRDQLYAAKVAAKRRARGKTIGAWARQRAGTISAGISNNKWSRQITRARDGILLQEETFGVFARRTAVLLLFQLLPVTAFGLLFTPMGYGANVFLTLNRAKGTGVYVGVIFVILFVIYIHDISYWPGRRGTVARRCVQLVCAVFMVLNALLSFAAYPYLPLMVFVILFMGYLRVLRILYPPDRCHIANFVRSLGVVLMTIGCFSLALVVAWSTFHRYRWLISLYLPGVAMF